MRRAVALLAVAVLTAATAVALYGALTVTVAGASSRACSRNLPVTHNANWVDMQAKRTCGFSYRAWGDWGGAYHYGTYRSVNGLHSVACDVSGCQSHPDGALFKGGYQVKRTGRLVCVFGCGIHTAAVVVVLDDARRASPSVTYTEHYNSGTACEASRPCWETIKIDSNPANRSVRAWASCTDGTTHLGSWHTSVGASSNTSSCATGAGIQRAGFDWNKSSPNRVTCYTFPDPVLSGGCGGSVRTG